ncbi:SDR family oxidoreductase [Marinicella rhabdoformis]|uniref:SDR family oxidoreductase n=1 Tax=Marinicella rhabdoformis TaxID=2580566 RepID=UPI0012AED5B5|nr:SDR family oxidoreductase [Marinicella rhabdoformis]
MKTILITGSNRGIGLELSRQFKAKGYQVLAVCRQSSEALDALGVEVISGCDVSRTEDLNQLKQQLSNRQIDVLLNNAGVLASNSLGEIDYDIVKWQFAINAVAPLQVTETLLPLMTSGGKVAIVTSRMGSVADNDSGGQYGYRMSKAAVNMAGKSLSVDLKPKGIAVALLHPGYVKTDMTSHNGLIDTAESANGLVSLIEQLNLDNTGGFWHTNGDALEW